MDWRTEQLAASKTSMSTPSLPRERRSRRSARSPMEGHSELPVERRSSCCFSFSRSPWTTAPRRHRRRHSTNMCSSACRRQSSEENGDRLFRLAHSRAASRRRGSTRSAKPSGEGTIQHQGDAAGSIYWLCYQRAQHRLWIASSEMGGQDHVVTDVVEELTGKDAVASTDCAVIPDKVLARRPRRQAAPWVCRVRGGHHGVGTAVEVGSCSERCILTSESSPTASMRPRG